MGKQGGTRNLQDAELRRLTQQVVPSGATEPFGAYVFGSGEPAAQLGRHVERTVFLEAFGNTPELLAEEYDPYEASSIFICVLDQMRRLPAGVMRVLLPSPAGFKSLKDIEPVWGEPADVLIARTAMGMDLACTWDIATLAVAPDYRGKATTGLVSMGLYQTLGMVTSRCGIDWLVAILDAVVYRILRKLQMPFTGYRGTAPMPYLGSAASLPVWCDVASMRAHIAGTDPDLYAAYFEGAGLEPAIRPVDLDCAEALVA